MGENFLSRWARRKAEQKSANARPDEDGDGGDRDQRSIDPIPAQARAPLPTMDDVGHLARDSDYSRFLSKGIDKTVRRAAMKKLFSDPHFNVMDGLDIYIDDYNRSSPVTAAMLASLTHTQSLFDAVAAEEARNAEAQAAEGLEPARAADTCCGTAEHGSGNDGEGGPIAHQAEVMRKEDGVGAPDEAASHAHPAAETRNDDDGGPAAQGRD